MRMRIAKLYLALPREMTPVEFDGWARHVLTDALGILPREVDYSWCCQRQRRIRFSIPTRIHYASLVPEIHAVIAEAASRIAWPPIPSLTEEQYACEVRGLRGHHDHP